jgi:ABC-type transport system substrate-binding protein
LTPGDSTGALRWGPFGTGCAGQGAETMNRARRSATFGIAVVVAVSACGPAPAPSSPAASSTPVAPATISSAAAGPPADTIRLGLYEPPGIDGYGLSDDALNAYQDEPGVLPLELLYDGLYHYDDHYNPVPDLAAKPCDVSTDGLTITCQLVTGTFADGSPFTADDVVFTYDVAFSSACPWIDLLGVACGPDSPLASVSASDPHTVVFRMKQPTGVLVTETLPSIKIEPKAEVEAEYQAIRTAAQAVGSSVIQKEADELHQFVSDQENATVPDCTADRAQAEADVAQVGITIGDSVAELIANEDDTAKENSCDHVRFLARALSDVANSLSESDPHAAIGDVHEFLPIGEKPDGTGPWRLVRRTTDELFLEAFAGHPGGAPATPKLDVRIYRDLTAMTDAINAGQLDWAQLPLVGADWLTAIRAARAVPGMTVLGGPSTTYEGIAFNLRPGRLFADIRLRKAFAMCFNHDATVESATDGDASPIESYVQPGSWAEDPSLVEPGLDVAGANALISQAGWKLGKDGIYEKDGRRLAAKVFVRQDVPERRKFMELVAYQVRSCGIDLTINPQGFLEAAPDIVTWPNTVPGEPAPFDLYFGGEVTLPEGDVGEWVSSQLTTKANPDGENFRGFHDPRVDALAAQALATYDVATRANLYRQIEDDVAAQIPEIFGYNPDNMAVISSRLESTAGPLDKDSARWYWNLESLKLGPGSAPVVTPSPSP